MRPEMTENWHRDRTSHMYSIRLELRPGQGRHHHPALPGNQATAAHQRTPLALSRPAGVMLPEAHGPKLDVDFTPLREPGQTAAGFGQAA